MKFCKGVAKVYSGPDVLATVIDNRAFSRIWPKWHSKTGYTVELVSGPTVVPDLEAVHKFIEDSKTAQTWAK